MIRADAKQLPIRSQSVDLVITSPPYFTSPLGGVNYGRLIRESVSEIRRILKWEGEAWVATLTLSGAERWKILRPSLPSLWGPPARHWYPAEGGWGRFYPKDVAALIRAHSAPGDVVYDPFGGTGVVAEVATTLGRIGLWSDLKAGTWN